MYEHLIEQTVTRMAGCILKGAPFVFTGRSTCASKLLKPHDVWKWFFRENRSYFEETYSYKPRGANVDPGTKGKVWEHIRDKVLPLALARVLEAQGITVDLRRMVKKETRNDEQHSEKALVGWEWKSSATRPWAGEVSAPYDDRPHPIDDEYCSIADPEEETGWWDYYGIGQEQVEAPVQEKQARRGKRKRGGSGSCKCGVCGGEKPQRATACASPCHGGAM